MILFRLVLSALLSLAPPAAADETKLTDGQIIGVLSVMNNAEIQAASLALARSQNMQVKSFASKVIEDQTISNREIAALGKTSEESETSRMLLADSRSELDRLGRDYGRAFDTAYLTQQAEADRRALETIERKLAPSAADPNITTLLVRIRSRIAEHLDVVRRLQSSLNATLPIPNQ
jgi:putative membrane protein